MTLSTAADNIRSSTTSPWLIGTTCGIETHLSTLRGNPRVRDSLYAAPVTSSTTTHVPRLEAMVVDGL